MSKEDLRKDILQEKGFTFSQATLRTEDLLTIAYNLIEEYNICTPLRKELQEILATIDDSGWFPREKREEAEDLLNEDVFYFLEGLAPEGYYFGNLPGDGAHFGWWTDNEDI
jgi:hypothetical protein